jgi:hypothetical protein
LKPDRFLVYVARAAIGAAVLAPFWFWKGGLLEIESLQFIRQYLDDRSPLRKIFDPYGNDFGTYQARELSYFLDFLDAQVFKRLMAMDITVFVPATALVASLLTVVVFFVAVKRYRAVSPLTGALLLLLYLTNYVHMITMGTFYRSSKPLLVPVLLAATFYLAALFERPDPPSVPTRRRRWLQAGAVFGLLSLMSLLDRQGFFYAVLGLVLIAGHSIRVRGRWDVVAAGAAAIACNALYNVEIGPAIVSAVNDYVPTRAYQEVPREPLMGGWRIYAQAAEVLMESVKVLLGSVPAVVGTLAFAVIAIAVVLQSRARVAAGIALAVLVASHVVLFALMIARLPAIYEWGDHRYFYYPLPAQAFMFAVMTILLGRLIAGWAGWRIAVLNILLAVAIVSNVAHWPAYRDRMRTSRWFPRIYEQTEFLKASFAAGRPHTRLIPQYREFYELCLTLSPGLRKQAGR